MPAVLRSLPFDQKNEQDFQEMTERIRCALDDIRKSRTLKPTQMVLAKLAKCSRRTLSLRIWPIEELRKIKEARSQHQQESPSSTKGDASKFNEGLLEKQVRNYQRQNGELFYRVQDLEEEKSRSDLIISTLENELEELREKVERLEKQSRRGNLHAI
jgi:gas vesicle protein